MIKRTNGEEMRASEIMSIFTDGTKYAQSVSTWEQLQLPHNVLPVPSKSQVARAIRDYLSRAKL